MSTQVKIDNTLNQVPSGDIVNYFEEQDKIIQKNDGTQDFKVITAPCYSPQTPFAQEATTKVKLTSSGVDIVNMDKGYISIKAAITFSMTKISGGTYVTNSSTSEEIRNYWIFVGLKSAAHLIDQYSVYSNGVKVINQTTALDEQNIVRLSKTADEIKNRPGMYTSFDNAFHGTEIVAGTYIKFEDLFTGPVTKTVEFNIQIDDLLPFSAMELFPRFLYGDLELEIKNTIKQNFVWCPVDLSSAYKNITPQFYNSSGAAIPSERELKDFHFKINKQFIQCGDNGTIPFCLWDSGATTSYGDAMIGYINVDSMTVNSCKSHVSGFNIKTTVKEELSKKYATRPMIIPCQWIETRNLSQYANESGFESDATIPLKNVTQLAFTFPRTVNQRTVSMNPLQNALTCKIGEKSFPDQSMSSLDSEHAEMMLSNLSMDSLFEAPRSLVNSLTFKEYNASLNANVICPDDNTDYMFTVKLERPGNGTFFDGYNDPHGAILITSNHIWGTSTPSFFTGGNLKTNRKLPAVHILSDAALICTSEGVRLLRI